MRLENVMFVRMSGVQNGEEEIGEVERGEMEMVGREGEVEVGARW
jgi:hypothetical protein